MFKNDSEVTIKVKEDIRSCYTKYVFLLGKINNTILNLVLLGLFTDRNDAFSDPCILQLVFVYLKHTKGTVIENLYFYYTLIGCT